MRAVDRLGRVTAPAGYAPVSKKQRDLRTLIRFNGKNRTTPIDPKIAVELIKSTPKRRYHD